MYTATISGFNNIIQFSGIQTGQTVILRIINTGEVYPGYTDDNGNPVLIWSSGIRWPAYGAEAPAPPPKYDDSNPYILDLNYAYCNVYTVFRLPDRNISGVSSTPELMGTYSTEYIIPFTRPYVYP